MLQNPLPNDGRVEGQILSGTRGGTDQNVPKSRNIINEQSSSFLRIEDYLSVIDRKTKGYEQ